jgi:hypothetical protein
MNGVRKMRVFETTVTKRTVVLGAALFALAVTTPAWAQDTSNESGKPEFKGVIKTDIRDSTPDWAPFTPAKALDGIRARSDDSDDFQTNRRNRLTWHRSRRNPSMIPTHLQ